MLTQHPRILAGLADLVRPLTLLRASCVRSSSSPTLLFSFTSSCFARLQLSCSLLLRSWTSTHRPVDALLPLPEYRYLPSSYPPLSSILIGRSCYSSQQASSQPTVCCVQRGSTFSASSRRILPTPDSIAHTQTQHHRPLYANPANIPDFYNIPSSLAIQIRSASCRPIGQQVSILCGWGRLFTKRSKMV